LVQALWFSGWYRHYGLVVGVGIVVRRNADDMFEQRVQALTAALKDQLELYEAEQRTLQVTFHFYY